MDKVSLELGSGGRTMRDFIARTIIPTLGNARLRKLLDASHLPGGIAFTTDSYVVDPIFFPGGDIGTLAVNGTANDLIVSGAVPRFISLALILEEGLEGAALTRILGSIRRASKRAGVEVVTGDTKVVRRGQGDKIFINTSGIGRVVGRPNPGAARPGDRIIVTGTLGEHSLAILLARGDFGLEARVRSDCAALNFLLPLWKKGAIWMRDITRGGLATILAELAGEVAYSLTVDEEAIPLSKTARAAAGLLGIDPLYLACEGRAALLVKERKADFILAALRKHPLGRRAAIIGKVDKTVGRPGELILRTTAGGLRLLEPLTSELLPRIC
jgi:hydrogenase expression/formation protein HypE